MPSKAQNAPAVKNASIKWVERLKFMGTSYSGHSIVMDAPANLDGDGSAATPSELVLMGLGGCTATDVIRILKKMRVPLKDLVIDIEALPVETDPKIYRWIKIVYHFHGCADITKARRAVEMSMNKYCSVSAMLAKSADINYELHFID